MRDQQVREFAGSRAAPPVDAYLDWLGQEDQAVYAAASGALDLTDEIRLMRTILARLASDILANKSVISQVLNSVVRAVAIQAKELSQIDDGVPALLAAADRILDEMEDEEE